jgi:hypothetical protein
LLYLESKAAKWLFPQEKATFETLCKILSSTSSVFGVLGLDFQGIAGLSFGCFSGPGEDFLVRPLVHRQDEPIQLSLGMVASQQSLLPFHWMRRL